MNRALQTLFEEKIPDSIFLSRENIVEFRKEIEKAIEIYDKRTNRKAYTESYILGESFWNSSNNVMGSRDVDWYWGGYKSWSLPEDKTLLLPCNWANIESRMEINVYGFNYTKEIEIPSGELLKDLISNNIKISPKNISEETQEYFQEGMDILRNKVLKDIDSKKVLNILDKPGPYYINARKNNIIIPRFFTKKGKPNTVYINNNFFSLEQFKSSKFNSKRHKFRFGMKTMDLEYLLDPNNYYQKYKLNIR